MSSYVTTYVDMESVLVDSVLQTMGLSILAVGGVTFALLLTEFLAFSLAHAARAARRTIALTAFSMLSIQVSRSAHRPNHTRNL